MRPQLLSDAVLSVSACLRTLAPRRATRLAEKRRAARRVTDRSSSRLTTSTYTRRTSQVILDGDHWSTQLPHIIEAFFVTEGGGAEWSSYVTKVHRDFLACFSLTAADVPLVQFDPSNFENPFSET